MIRLGIRVRRAEAELVLAELLELSRDGFEELEDGETVEYAVYGASEDELPSDAEISAAAGDALIALDRTQVADDWADRWRDFHKPLVLGDRLSVRPPWETPIGTALEIVIDPGQAFGTGAHATTRLCLEALLDIDEMPAAAIDLGCGSGVLGIAAAMLGTEKVLALDYDPLSVAATIENAAVNGVSDKLEVRRLDLLKEEVPAAPLILANLLGPLLLAWCIQFETGAERPEMIIASGLLATEADHISEAFAAVGLAERSRLLQDEWAALVFSSRGAR